MVYAKRMERREAVQQIALMPVVAQAAGLSKLVPADRAAPSPTTIDARQKRDSASPYWARVTEWSELLKTELARFPVTKLRDMYRESLTAFQDDYFGDGSDYHRGMLTAVWEVLDTRKLMTGSRQEDSDFHFKPEEFFHRILTKAALLPEERQISKEYREQREAKHAADTLKHQKAEARVLIARIIGDVVEARRRKEETQN